MGLRSPALQRGPARAGSLRRRVLVFQNTGSWVDKDYTGEKSKLVTQGIWQIDTNQDGEILQAMGTHKEYRLPNASRKTASECIPWGYGFIIRKEQQMHK